MDKYIILLRIGEGAHGVVYKAKHIESGEVVALKKVFRPVFVYWIIFWVVWVEYTLYVYCVN